MSSDTLSDPSRRGALKCLAFGGAGTLFVLAGGVLAPVDLALAAAGRSSSAGVGVPLLPADQRHPHRRLQQGGQSRRRPERSSRTDRVRQCDADQTGAHHPYGRHHPPLQSLRSSITPPNFFRVCSITELHTTPGEHDVTDGPGTEYFSRFGQASDNRGYYSFDHQGVHFIALVNVMHFKPNGLGGLGDDQLAWLEADLKGRPSSTPIVVFAHMPMWTIYQPWGWGTGDADQAFSYMKRFGSVTVLNGHIHQIVSKVEGNITFHTARSTAYPQPTAGAGAGPMPLKVPSDQLPKMLGVTSVELVRHPLALSLTDTTLA